MSSQHPSKDDDQTVNYYNENAKQYIDDTFALDLTPLYQPFLKLIQPDGHILDVGCGAGRDSLYFIQHGYRVTAIDASEQMAKHASAVTGLDVKQIQFEEVEYEQEFDAIWACASIIHTSSQYLDAVIERMADALKPSGIFYLSFKYGEKEEIRNGRLFNDFTEAKFLRLMEKHPRLQLISTWLTGDVRTDRSSETWLNVLLRKLA